MQEVTGDIAGAAGLRMTQPIGALMLAVRESEELCDDIYETWVHDSQVSLCPLSPVHCTSQSNHRPIDITMPPVSACSQFKHIPHACCNPEI